MSLRHCVLSALATTCVTVMLASPMSGAASYTWTPATSLGTGNSAQINGISCASAGNCIAVGSLDNGATAWQETSGTWGAPISLSAGGSAHSIVCPTATSCAIAGQDNGGLEIWYLTGGTLSSTTTLSPPANPRTPLSYYFLSGLSCPTISTCAVAGFGQESHYGSNDDYQTFTSEASNNWASQWVSLPSGGTDDRSLDISCSSVGNCAVVGQYSGGAFEVTETGGTWGTAGNLRIAGETDGIAFSVSCGGDGSCAAVGTTGSQAFYAELSGGSWTTTAISPAGGNHSSGDYVSCSSAGNCTAVGSYTLTSGVGAAFGISETGGSWDSPVTLRQNIGAYNYLHSFTCWSAGNCIWGGQISTDGGTTFFPAVQMLVNGTWGDQVQLASNLGALSDGQTYAVGCASDGSCAAGGNLTVTAGGVSHAWIAEMVAVQPTPTPTPTPTPSGNQVTPAHLAMTGLNFMGPVAVAMLLLASGVVVAARRRRREERV